MQAPAGRERDNCYQNMGAAPGSAAAGQMDQDCAQLHPGGAATHVDPPESQIEGIEAEYEASCRAGNCALSNATYASLESQGHSRGEVDCFMAEGERRHNEQHEGGNHDGQHHDQEDRNGCQQGERYPDDHRCSNPQGSTSEEPNLDRGNDCQQGERYPDDHRCSNP